MAFSKITFNGTTLMDVTQKTVTAGSMLYNVTALKNDGTDISGTIASKSSTDLTVSGATVTAPAGYYSADASKSVASGSATTPATSITANPSISVNSSTGLITATASASKSVAPTVVSGYVSSGTSGTITVSGSNTSQLSTQSGSTITPTEAEQTAVAAGKYTLGAVKIGAIPSDYIGSGIDIRDSTDLTASGATVTAPAGYYSVAASKSIASGSVAVPNTQIPIAMGISLTGATGLITVTVDGSESVSPTVSAGYVSSGTAGTITVSDSHTYQLQTQAGTTITPTESEQTAVASGKYTTGAVKVAAISSTYVGSEVPRNDSTDLTASGATITAPAGYYAEDATKSVASGSATTPATSITANPSISVNSSTGLITATTSASKSVTPTVSAGFVSSGTAGTVSVSGSNTSQLATQAGTTVSPTESEQTAVAAGKYTLGAVKVGAISSTYVGSEVPRNDSTDLTASGATITAPAGYYAEDATKSIVSGSATTPATSITANPSITLNSETGVVSALVLTSQSVTPTVVAGYVSSGTAGTITVSGGKTASLSTQAAATYYPSASDQTLSRGVYLTGDQTVKAVLLTNLSAANIKDSVTVEVGDSVDSDRVTSVTGTFTDASTVTTGQTAATASEIVSGYSAWVDGSEVLGSIPSKTSSDVEVDDGVVTIPSGYYASEVIISAPIGIEYYYTGTTVPSSDLGSDGDLYFKTT